MSWILFFALVAFADASEATAPQIVVTVDEGASLPDDVETEIRDALRSRSAGLHAGLIQIHLRQRVAEIRVDSAFRSVPIEEWESGAAARVVVLHAVDLANPPTSSPAPPPDLDAAPPPKRDAAPPTVVTVPGPPAAALPTLLVVSAGPRFSYGFHRIDAPAPGGELSVGMRRDRARLSVGLRWSHGLSLVRDQGTANEATFDMYPATLTAGWSFWRLEATVEPFVGPAQLTAAAGPSLSSLTYGVGAGLRWVGRPAAGIGWFAGVGLEGYARRLSYEIGGITVYATPRVAPYAALGVSFGAPP